MPRLRLISAASVAAAVLLSAPAAPAQPTIEAPIAGSDAPVVHDPRLGAELAGVAVVGPAVADAYARYRRDEDAHTVAVADRDRAEAELAELGAARTRLEEAIIRSTRRRDKSESAVGALRTAVAAIAVEQYVQGNSTSSVELDLSAGSATRARGRRAVSGMVRARQVDALRGHTAALADARAQLESSTAELADVVARQSEVTARRDEASGREQRLAAALVADARAVGDARLTSTVRGADFVLVALDAYHRGAATMRAERPACGIHWSLLAGIGKTESGHGTFRGATLAPDGTVTRPIIGIPLDGTNGTAVIRDSDGGALDGDTVVDRAVGPMQFIPTTWARWGRDANGDGRVDPQNLYDAAVAAAGYLCDSGGDLATDAGRRTAVYRYNTDDSYVATVLGRAAGYAGLGLV